MATAKLRDIIRRLLRPVRRRRAGSPALRQKAEPPLADASPTPEAEAPAEESSQAGVDTARTDSSALRWDSPRNSAGAACTQFGNTGSREKVDLLIGLDFGTSSAKVAIRSPYLGRGNVTAVTWPDGSGERSFLLPTNLSAPTPSGRIAVETRPSPADRSLKVDLMECPDSVDARANAACYLAWVLRTSRCHLLSSQQETYGSYPLRWALNLGIPSAGYDDVDIKKGFRIAGAAAWALSVQKRPPTRSEAFSTVNRLSGLGSEPESLLDLEEIEVVPEIVAEAARYAQSYRRRNGLHFLVDVGASTIDSCGFVLHEREGEDRWALLNALVEPLGVLHLHRDRLNALADAGFAIHPEVPPRDAGPFDRIPDRVRDYLADKNVEPPEGALQVDRGYREDVVEALRKVIWDLKKNRDPNSPHWSEGLLVFVAGGGRGLSILRDGIRAAESQIRSVSLNVGDFRYMDDTVSDGRPGPAPSDDPLDEGGAPEAVGARLGVAYGLSLPDIGSVTPPARIGDVRQPPPKPRPFPDYWGGKH